MSTTCPRCSRTLSDAADPAAAPLFCMYCGERLKPPTHDETVVRVIPPSADLFASGAPAMPTDLMNTRSGGADSSSEAPAAHADAAPSSVGGFRLLKFIGGGGMGNVYEGVNPNTGEKVAVKLLNRRLASSPASVERFRQEGRLASQLTHPRCVFVMRADTENGRPFIVMELMPGQTLKDVVDKKGPLPVAAALDYMLDVIDGLIEAHRLGVIHRDVKPSNCFLTDDGRVKVGDFGLSKSLANETGKQLTHSGTFLGTVLFAPPEQIRHEPVGFDSDVYAVSATLYYLLAGQAPHQHDSLTAVLAKAISEPAPPLRPKRPDVPKALERVILRGLERDRTRRYQTLEELRAALSDLLPQNETSAGLRALVLAYLVDVVILQTVLFPLELLRSLLFVGQPQVSQYIGMGMGGVLSFVYFALFEGLCAASPGKALFRLRVRRVGKTGPPGMLPAVVRTLVYSAIWWVPTFALMGLGLVYGSANLFLLLMPVAFLLSIGVTLLQVRKTSLGHRGVHDIAAGTRVIQKRPPARVTRLLSRHPNPLGVFVPAEVTLPERVGLFRVLGKVCDAGDGAEIWAGEDDALGRAVVVRVEAPGVGDDSLFDEPTVRPARLRAVGHGTLKWQGEERAWAAFVAPAGAPLPDLVDAKHPLRWADARGVLDQVAAELADAEADQTLPPALTPEQVWVGANGRVQLLDFPLPTGRDGAGGEGRGAGLGTSDPLTFLRRVVALTLEGHPRNTDDPLAAPLPQKSAAMLNRLMEEGGYESAEQFRHALADDRHHPAEVGTAARAGHLSVQAVLCGFWLLLMFAFAGFVSWAAVLPAAGVGEMRARLLASLEDPDQRQAWAAAIKADPTDATGERGRAAERWLLEEPTDAALAPLRATVARDAAHRTDVDRRLNAWERWLLDQTIRFGIDTVPLQTSEPRAVQMVGRYMLKRDRQPAAPTADPDEADDFIPLDDITLGFGVVALVFVGVWPLFLWPLSAFVFRGGAAGWLAGVSIVRNDGRPAPRWLCGLRCLLAWLPLLLLLVLVVLMQITLPYWVYARTSLWLLALALLPLMAMAALRRPDRGPLDKLLGTTLVPR